MRTTWFALLIVSAAACTGLALSSQDGDPRDGAPQGGDRPLSQPAPQGPEKSAQAPSAPSQGPARGTKGFARYTQSIPGSPAKFEMLPIPGGEFLLGSPKTEADRSADEGPQRKVRIKPFWMAKCETTWALYDTWSQSLDVGGGDKEILAKVDGVSRPTPAYTDMTFGMGRDGYPAICMTQHAAKSYCEWLSAITGHEYRLPTEAEWEYACRAGTTTAYHFGDDASKLPEYGWFEDNADEEYHPVGKLKPNPWGLHDMHGNVCEWVLDQYAADTYTKLSPGKTLANPLVEPKTEYPRSARGGSWMDPADRLRSAARLGSDESWKDQDPQLPKSIWYHTDALFLGFRVVREWTPPKTAK